MQVRKMVCAFKLQRGLSGFISEKVINLFN